MADHVQQQILDAVKAVLVAAATVASTRVYLDRVDEVPQANLPAIDILPRDAAAEETIEATTFDWPPTQRRELTFAINCTAAGQTDSAKAARNLGKQVEQALLASLSAVSVGGYSVPLAIIASATSSSGAGATALSTQGQTWRALYYTQAGVPDAVN